jgi:hypothetical protein
MLLHEMHRSISICRSKHEYADRQNFMLDASGGRNFHEQFKALHERKVLANIDGVGRSSTRL